MIAATPTAVAARRRADLGRRIPAFKSASRRSIDRH
jgi:hypothetical protein